MLRIVDALAVLLLVMLLKYFAKRTGKSVTFIPATWEGSLN
jgi:hypothetical protein